MKAKFLALAALVLGMVSCQNEPEGFDVNVGGAVDTVVTVNIPEAETRAYSDSALSVFNNGVLDGAATMRYILQVYDAAGNASDERLVKYSDGKSVNFDVRLIPGRNYQFVVWVDVVDAEADVDKHYYTRNLKEVTLNGEWKAMDETRDAFTTTELIKNFNSQSGITLTVKRPFAKLRVVTTDTEALNNLDVTPTTAVVRYATKHRASFNAYAGTYADATIEDKTHEYAIVSYGEDVANNANRTLFTDYFFADNDVVKFYLSVKDQWGEKIIADAPFTTDISVKRNHLTTIKGNILTDNSNFTITVEDGFDGFISEGGDEADNKNIVDLLKANEEVIEVTLTENVEIDGRFTFGGADTKSITINGTALTRAGERPVITLTNGYNYYFKAVNPNAKLYLNDVEIVVVDDKKNTWDLDDLLIALDVEANNVKFNSAVALDGNKVAKFDGCSFNETRDLYALWIRAEKNKSVTIANSTFESAGRAIKVADEYVDDVTKVSINVSGTSFKSVSKAAVLVSSTAGADIVWGEGNDITEVAADPINAVWVDEDWADYADLVTVTGASKVIEGSADTNIVVVSNADELKSAISNASATEVTIIYLKGGNYAGYFLVSDKKILLTTTEDVTIDGLINLTGNTAYVGVRNMTLTNANPQNHYDTNKYLSRANGYIFGVYNGSLDIQDCTINVVATGAINQHADVTGNVLTVKNTTFNCNGQRPIRARANVHIEGCTFVDQQRYAVQSQFNNTLSSQSMVFVNNKIVNPCVTSGEAFAAGVQISHSQICENVAFTIANNELTSTKFNDLKFAYDHEEASTSFGNIKITTCTLNGQQIKEHMCFEIDAKTNEVLPTAPAVVEGAYQITNADEFMFINERGMGSVTGLTFCADINLEGREINPITKSGIVVKGNNFTVSNFSITNKTQAALFGNSSRFNISGLTIKNATFTAQNVDGEDSAAAFLGFVQLFGGENVLENCHAVECTIGSAKYVGGLIAYRDGNSGSIKIKDCSVTGSELKSLYTEDGQNYKGHCGGVIGYFANPISIENCRVANNTFDVRGPRCGIFVGSANGTGSTASGTYASNIGLDALCGVYNKIDDWSNVVAE